MHIRKSLAYNAPNSSYNDIVTGKYIHGNND